MKGKAPSITVVTLVTFDDDRAGKLQSENVRLIATTVGECEARMKGEAPSITTVKGIGWKTTGECEADS